jgi:lactate dehydrogenase-like 2-hydroxyacid dehydrogenase
MTTRTSHWTTPISRGLCPRPTSPFLADHVSDPGEIVDRLQPFDVLCVMRERTPLPRAIIEQLPRLKLIASTGPGNASIDERAAAEHHITVTYTGYRSTPTIELTWALIQAAARDLLGQATSLRR